MTVVNNLQHIIKSYNEKKLSHAFLIETNDYEKCYQELKKIIKIINCENKYNDDCTLCNLCYQIDNETLPNFINIIPEGTTIKKNQILELKEKIIIKPIYSKYNIYVISHAEKLNISSANTMLKFIEEPEENTLGFFITDNKENIIETIKSRCQLIFQYYEENYKIIDKEKLVLIDDYIKNIELDNKHALLYNKNIFLEKDYSRDEIVKIFKHIFSIYECIYSESDDDYLNKYSFIYNKPKSEIVKKLKLINKVIDELNMNGNINLILDSFAIEMR